MGSLRKLTNVNKDDRRWETETISEMIIRYWKPQLLLKKTVTAFFGRKFMSSESF